MPSTCRRGFLAVVGSDDRVLDIGCGTGRVALLAARKASGGPVVGVDISAPMPARARAEAAAQDIGNVAFEGATPRSTPSPTSGAGCGRAGASCSWAEGRCRRQ